VNPSSKPYTQLILISSLSTACFCKSSWVVVILLNNLYLWLTDKQQKCELRCQWLVWKRRVSSTNFWFCIYSSSLFTIVDVYLKLVIYVGPCELLVCHSAGWPYNAWRWHEMIYAIGLPKRYPFMYIVVSVLLLWISISWFMSYFA